MIRLSLDHDVLLIQDNENDLIFEWDHKLFFTVVAGFELSDENHCYRYFDRSKRLVVLRDSVEYLQEHGLNFVVDTPVQQLLGEMAQNQNDFEEVLKDYNDLKMAKVAEITPPHFLRSLKPYQANAVRHLLTIKHGANFSVPGSGKTTVIYAVFDILRSQGVIEKLLVVGPRSSFQPWEEEYLSCFGERAESARLTGPKTQRYGIYLSASQYSVMIATYQAASNDINEIIELCRKYKMMVVVDESHNIKKFQSGVWSDALLTIAPFATRRAILSGTPVPNSYEDLWTQITYLWPSKQVLGEREPYRHKCEQQKEYPNIRRAIKPFFVRVRKNELDLPPFTVERLQCSLKPYQATIYHALSVRFLKELSAPPEDKRFLQEWRKAKMVRLIQAASNPALLAQYSEEFDVPPLSGEGASISQLIEQYPRYEIPAKIEYVEQLIRELTEKGKKVVVWTSFVHNIRMLERLLSDLSPFVVYGAIPKDESEDVEFNREQQIQQFKDSPGPGILIANPAACAESVSLHTTCHDAVYLDRTFNAGQFMQSMDRIHRVGLGRDVKVSYYIILAENTIDETVDRRLVDKQKAMEHLLDDELPIGTLETSANEMVNTIAEELLDFEQTIKDIQKQQHASGQN